MKPLGDNDDRRGSQMPNPATIPGTRTSSKRTMDDAYMLLRSVIPEVQS
jgi:hypothetical protein